MTLGLWTFIALFAAAAALRFAMAAEAVAAEHIYAALSAYMLAGIFFGLFYWVVEQIGPGCDKPEFTVPILRGKSTLGALSVCIDKRRRVPGLTFVLAIAAACLSLWGASGALARKRPIVPLDIDID